MQMTVLRPIAASIPAARPAFCVRRAAVGFGIVAGGAQLAEKIGDGFFRRLLALDGNFLDAGLRAG